MESILLVSLLLIVIFGSKPLFEMFRKKREGEELIGNPWEEIHAIPGYKESRKVAAFYPLTGEPNIMPIIEQLADEDRLLLPRCTGPTTMEFCHVQSLKKDLVKGKFGIMEPRGDIPAYEGDFTVFLVPGTKFNLTGERTDTARVTTTGSWQSTRTPTRQASRLPSRLAWSRSCKS